MSLLETENIKFFFTAHSEPISCSSGMPVEHRGIIFNHMSSKLWETLEKRAIWHSFSFHWHNSLCGQWHLRRGSSREKHSFVRKLSLIKLRHGDNNKVSFRERSKGIAWTNEIKTLCNGQSVVFQRAETQLIFFPTSALEKCVFCWECRLSKSPSFFGVGNAYMTCILLHPHPSQISVFREL